MTKQTYSITSTNESYAYDNNSQLTKDTINNTAINYTYDNNGNRLSLKTNTSAGLGFIQEILTYSNNRIASWTKAVSTTSTLMTLGTNAGTGEITATYMGGAQYDAMGRRRYEDPYVYMDYSHKNERTLRETLGNDRQYAYDESSHLIGEYDLFGTLVVEYVWLGDRPIAAVYPGNRIVYIVTDQQNKPRRGIDAQTQQVVWSWDPDAFGVIQPQAGLANAVSINLRFPGQYYDSQSGLYYNHNRFYNPELGRYMEADPTGLEGGLNPYSYAANDPVNKVDLTGKAWVYVWLQNGSFGSQNFEWGHASMSLENGTHISWWPNNSASSGGQIINRSSFSNQVYTAPAFQNQTYGQDVLNEGRAPDYKVQLYSLNEGAIQKWWDSYKTSNTWSSLSQNCSTTIAKALDVGGARVDWYNQFKTNNIIWSPSDVKDYSSSTRQWEIGSDINSFNDYKIYQQNNMNFSFTDNMLSGSL